MIVNVDEAGSDDESSAVDDRVTSLRLHVADGDDAVVDEANVGPPQRRSGTVRQIRANDRRRAIGRATGHGQGEQDQNKEMVEMIPHQVTVGLCMMCVFWRG